ncbi:MAG: molybdate ABC transporter substrate-binding protein, partial [Terrimesophilobacter sp.]
MTRRTRFRELTAFSVTALSVVGVLAIAACSPTPDSTSPSNAPSDASAPALHGQLTIFAAASLTASFTELATDFSEQNPGVTVNPISFDGSSTLATQIIEGAPADVFASADEANMQKVNALLSGSPTSFASNVLQIAVQPGNPLGISGLSDLAKP